MTGRLDNAVIHEAFAQQAARRPDAVALVDDHVRLTYRELDARAGRVADALRRFGVGPNVAVGVHLHRSVEFVITLLGVLKAGGGYVPLDPAEPPAWRRRQVESSRAAVVVVAADDDDGPGGVAAVTVEQLLTDTDAERRPAVHPARPQHLAYVLFTSGSTGTPKAVAVPHAAVTAMAGDQTHVRLGPDERVLFHSTTVFDASTFEVWAPLLHGGRVVVAPPGLQSVRGLSATMRRHGVTSAFLTSALFQLTVDEDPAALAPLRQLLVGGDVVSAAHVERMRQHAPHCVVVAIYGPTEATVYATAHRLTAGDPTPAVIPIGTPLGFVDAHVLDDGLRPVDEDEGELYLTGPGLAWGYLDAPDLTAERFLPDPFASRPGGRMYRTGDRVRRRNGVLEFVGRVDAQTKIRGHRIEPAEVELALLQHPDVSATYVTTEHNPVRGKYLVAYVSCPPSVTLDEADLRAHMSVVVPSHLRPDRYIIRRTLPLTSQGKIDRRRLLDAAPGAPAQAPDDETRYAMLVNDERQTALWPVGQPIPAGWSVVAKDLTKAEVLAEVRRRWRDICPASARVAATPPQG